MSCVDWNSSPFPPFLFPYSELGSFLAAGAQVFAGFVGFSLPTPIIFS